MLISLRLRLLRSPLASAILRSVDDIVDDSNFKSGGGHSGHPLRFNRCYCQANVRQHTLLSIFWFAVVALSTLNKESWMLWRVQLSSYDKGCLYTSDNLYRSICKYPSVIDRTMHIVCIVQGRSHGNVDAALFKYLSHKLGIIKIFCDSPFTDKKCCILAIIICNS